MTNKPLILDEQSSASFKLILVIISATAAFAMVEVRLEFARADIDKLNTFISKRVDAAEKRNKRVDINTALICSQLKITGCVLTDD